MNLIDLNVLLVLFLSLPSSVLTNQRIVFHIIVVIAVLMRTITDFAQLKLVSFDPPHAFVDMKGGSWLPLFCSPVKCTSPSSPARSSIKLPRAGLVKNQKVLIFCLTSAPGQFLYKE